MQHNVVEVSTDSADICADSANGVVVSSCEGGADSCTSGQYTYTVPQGTSAGSTKNFICGVPGHCASGQKVVITGTQIAF